MLGVDRKQEPSPTLVRGQGELAGGDEALLVRERERDAPLERPPCEGVQGGRGVRGGELPFQALRGGLARPGRTGGRVWLNAFSAAGTGLAGRLSSRWWPPVAWRPCSHSC